MSPVGGSRFYDGGGLGQEGAWGCPSCGEDNTGPIAQGCVHCGAGKPGRRVEAPPPPPRVSERAPDDPTYQPVTSAGVTSAWEQWAEANPDASIAEAYRAGYINGIRAARAAAEAGGEITMAPEGKVTRTILAALELFRDQVLAEAPEEVATGEWCSTEEITALIHRLREQEASYAL